MKPTLLRRAATAAAITASLGLVGGTTVPAAAASGDGYAQEIAEGSRFVGTTGVYKWTAGWTTTEVIDDRYLFHLKESTGDVHVSELTASGTVGKLVYDQKWTTGWTEVEPFLGLVNGRASTLLLEYKASTGQVHIQRFQDGRPTTVQSKSNIGIGWTDIVETSSGLFAYNSSTGLAGFISVDYRTGVALASAPIRLTDIGKGWDLVDRISHWSIAVVDTQSGTAQIRSISGSFSSGLTSSVHRTANWTSGYTYLEPLVIGGYYPGEGAFVVGKTGTGFLKIVDENLTTLDSQYLPGITGAAAFTMAGPSTDCTRQNGVTACVPGAYRDFLFLLSE